MAVPVEVTDTIREGVVSPPHGWGHDTSTGTIAAARPGVNSNLIGDPRLLDGPTGTALVNGIPVMSSPPDRSKLISYR